MSFIRFASFRVIFEIRKGDEEAEITVPVIIYWDRDKVIETINNEIIENIRIDEFYSPDNEIVLPKIVDGKKWAIISWEASDDDIIEISGKYQKTADTLFEPYAGIIKGSTVEEPVTLKATVNFQFTNDINGGEKPITVSKEYSVIISALSEEQRKEIIDNLSEKLEAGFKKAGLKDAVTGEALEKFDEKYIAYNDVLFPTTRDFGVDGKYYPVKIASSNEDVIKAPDVNNAARVEVIRPAEGEADNEALITISISDKETSLCALKEFEFIVPALTKDEIEAEKALMEKVKTAYFDGIKGENTDSENISSDLSPFIEVYEENDSLVWVRDVKSKVNHGIIPTPMEGWEELEAWRLFKSSNPAVIAHETLFVTLQKNAKAVTVNSALSSETLGKYGKLYLSDPIKYEKYSDLAELYYNEVSAELAVRGRTTSKTALKAAPVKETINVSFELENVGETLIEKTDYKELDETITVYDVFKKALGENGFSFKNKGSYISEITTPEGETIKEFDKGENSGWMYKVNGKIPSLSLGAYGLKDGDRIMVFYTEDYTEENNSSSHKSGGSSAVKKTEVKGEDNNSSYEKNTDKKNENTEGKSREFKDVKGHWAEKDIEKIVEKGIMKGISEEEFSPDTPITRAMFVTVLYRLEGEPKAGKAAFSDIESGSWYENAVGWASENNLVNGVTSKGFEPNEEITREQLVTILYRYAKLKGYATDTEESGFADNDEISDWAKEAVFWAVKQKIIFGTDENKVLPSEATTRAQTAAIIIRFLNNFTKG